MAGRVDEEAAEEFIFVCPGVVAVVVRAGGRVGDEVMRWFVLVFSRRSGYEVVARSRYIC